MSILFVLFITAIQFVVQYCIYKQFRDWLYEKHSNHLSTLKLLPTELFFINLGCTIFVCFLTSAGLVTGITNLFASALLALVMKVQYNNYKKALLDGSYYTKLQEKKQKELEEQQDLKQIAKERKERLQRGYF